MRKAIYIKELGNLVAVFRDEEGRIHSNYNMYTLHEALVRQGHPCTKKYQTCNLEFANYVGVCVGRAIQKLAS